MKRPLVQRSLIVVSLCAWALLPFLETEAALEVIDPSSLCERFEKKSELEKCAQLVETKKPDTYFASACQNLQQSSLFWKCLDTATRAEVDPRDLEKCADPELEDEARWSCLTHLASKPTPQFQKAAERQPAANRKSKAPPRP